ncbi:gluconate 2-dehydrogenase subunit 3 family protein [Spirosoma telluris]|uniref:gluconate 2-dehydrogenase subunit 3 family protein n=1 Tax=Spirosoma telluris TaxID=2183553 RepID=UPI002FC35700
MGEIVGTIIPETTTPGAKTLKVHQFAMRMINDCYGEPAQTLLTQGLRLVDATAQQTYTKPFVDCDTSQRMDVLTKLASSTDRLENHLPT